MNEIHIVSGITAIPARCFYPNQLDSTNTNTFEVKTFGGWQSYLRVKNGFPKIAYEYESYWKRESISNKRNEFFRYSIFQVIIFPHHPFVW